MDEIVMSNSEPGVIARDIIDTYGNRIATGVVEYHNLVKAIVRELKETEPNPVIIKSFFAESGEDWDDEDIDLLIKAVKIQQSRYAEQ